ncbi:MAG: LysR family transcriptional regulator [Lautropia sp.]|nr:LysR family transcriptional regulator [Lautropia sp.]
MDTLNSMRVFCRVVELGSFTRAAEALDMSTAMASKHLKHLEDHVQARLLNRSSRRLSLTEAGAAYHEQCLLALQTLDEARENARQGAITPQGLLKLTMPVWCATPRMAKLLADYQRAYPQVRLSLHLDSQHTDLVAHGMDLALRVTARPEPNLIVRPLATVPFDWVASPDYLARHGMPKNIDDLNQHLTVLPDYTAINLPATCVAESNSSLMLHQLTLAGMGIAYLPDWLTTDDLAHGKLQRIPTLPSRGTHRLYAVYLDRAYLSAKVRSFIDFMAARVVSTTRAGGI